MKLKFFSNNPSRLHPPVVHRRDLDDEIILSSSADNILLTILRNNKHCHGTIKHSLFKSDKPCIGIRRHAQGESKFYNLWDITFSNINGINVGCEVVICERGFKQNVGSWFAKWFDTHYFIIETHE